MQVAVNQRLLRRRLWLSISQTLSSLLLLVLGFFASLTVGDPVIQYGVSIPALLLGLLFWGRNQAYLQRWGPHNRLDPVLIRALKGLDDRYALVVAPAEGLPDYLLVGPMGVVVLVPRVVPGQTTAYHDQWRNQHDPSALQRVFRWLSARPSLGNPTQEAERGVTRTAALLDRRLPDTLANTVPIEAVAVFVHPQATLVLQGNRVPALLLKSLRAHIRRAPRALTPDATQWVLSALSPA